jgi:hypothetical protein
LKGEGRKQKDFPLQYARNPLKTLNSRESTKGKERKRKEKKGKKRKRKGKGKKSRLFEPD